MAILILVRHGQSVYNLENRFTGSLDVPLTALGEKEALLAGQKLLPFTFDFAYTSTLKRAALSLRIIMEAIHQSSLVVIKSKSLDERYYGSLQGLNKEETIAKYGVKQVDTWRRSYAVAPPDGESLSDTFHRVVPFYKEKIEPQLKLQKNILVVAHGNSLRALVMYLEKMSPAEIAQFNIPTGIPRQYILDENLTILSAKYLL